MRSPWRGRVGKAWRPALLWFCVVGAVVLATVVEQRPAMAQGEELLIEEGEVDDGDLAPGAGDFFVPLPVDQLVALPGICPTAAPIEPGNSVDCSFQILPGVDTAVLQFADIVFDGNSWACHVDAGVGGWDRLVCPGLLGGRFEEGAVAFTLRIEGELADEAATVSLTWSQDPAFSLFGDGGGESVVFAGRPLRWSAYVYEPIDGLFLNFRERNGSDIVSSVPIDVADVFESAEGSIVPDLPDGRYRLWPCVGTTAATCDEQPGGRSFQIIDGEPLELVPGHNRRSADRINVLFVSSGLERFFNSDPAKQLPELARTMLTIDGPDGVGFDGELIGASEPADRLLWGPMAIEPLASHRDRFNFWYLSDEIADELGLLFSGLEPSGDDGFDLPNVQITALYNDGSDFVSDARRTSFETLEPSEVPVRGRIRFGDARVWVPRFAPLSGATTLAHEWGHGLFGLRDEYYGFDDRGIAEGFPNCAPDIETAELWWGAIVGEVDPFVSQVLEIQEARLLQPEFVNIDLAERTAIDVTAGGCYSDFGSTEVYRPSVDSLMNSEVPVFGVVNRQRVQEVLDRFSGRGPLSSLDELTMSCEGLAGFVNCRGELLSHLDKPLSIVAINANPCEFGSARSQPDGTRSPVPITCSTIGDPTAAVDLSFKNENLAIEVVDVNLPPVPSIPQRVLAERESLVADRALAATEAAEADSEDGTSTGRTVAIGVLLCIAAISLGFVERRRRRSSAYDEIDAD